MVLVGDGGVGYRSSTSDGSPTSTVPPPCRDLAPTTKMAPRPTPSSAPARIEAGPPRGRKSRGVRGALGDDAGDGVPDLVAGEEDEQHGGHGDSTGRQRSGSAGEQEAGHGNEQADEQEYLAPAGIGVPGPPDAASGGEENSRTGEGPRVTGGLNRRRRLFNPPVTRGPSPVREFSSPPLAASGGPGTPIPAGARYSCSSACSLPWPASCSPADPEHCRPVLSPWPPCCSSSSLATRSGTPSPASSPRAPRTPRDFLPRGGPASILAGAELGVGLGAIFVVGARSRHGGGTVEVGDPSEVLDR